MRKKKIRKIAKTDSYVLIQGKTGTGKEIVAQSIHFASGRSDKPFISQNCAAIPANLLESTLFGTEKGSFTGAITNKGLFELADGGTIFLDEINSMDISVQSKILKAIEERSIRRIGGHKNISTDIRIIAAINEDPFEAIRNNRLREDLFYRLNIVSLKLNELKDRKNDIKLLTDYYIHFYNDMMKMKIKGLDEKVEKIFLSHDWPGNVRELRNVIESAFNITETATITAEDIPDYLVTDLCEVNADREEVAGYEDMVREFESRLIRDALKNSRSKAEAARNLNLTRQTLNYKMEKLRISE